MHWTIIFFIYCLEYFVFSLYSLNMIFNRIVFLPNDMVCSGFSHKRVLFNFGYGTLKAQASITHSSLWKKFVFVTNNHFPSVNFFQIPGLSFIMSQEDFHSKTEIERLRDENAVLRSILMTVSFIFWKLDTILLIL